MSASTTFQIQQVDDEGNATHFGVLTLDEQGQVTLQECEPAMETILQEIITEVNGSAELRIKEAVPSESGSRIGWRTVSRDAPDYAWVLEQYFDQKYDLQLVDTSQGLAEEQPE